jgi:hypothetical protein
LRKGRIFVIIAKEEELKGNMLKRLIVVITKKEYDKDSKKTRDKVIIVKENIL